MENKRQSYRYLTCAVPFLLIVSAVAAQHGQRQTLAPHELRASVPPPAIIWPTPPMPDGPIEFESAMQRHLRATVITRGPEQPWSMAFMPDGSMLVTQR